MTWTTSRMFRQTVADRFNGANSMNFLSDTIKAALYNNTPTPDANVAAAASAYNTGQFVVANEVSGMNWPAGGIALASKVVDVATASVVMLDAADTASTGNATLANVYGALVYDDTLTTPVADQGISFNYFGGVQSVTNGIFTAIWNANGIARATV